MASIFSIGPHRLPGDTFEDARTPAARKLLQIEIFASCDRVSFSLELVVGRWIPTNCSSSCTFAALVTIITPPAESEVVDLIPMAMAMISILMQLIMVTPTLELFCFSLLRLL